MILKEEIGYLTNTNTMTKMDYSCRIIFINYKV